MSKDRFKDRSRAIARELYWQENDREQYECPDCGRRESEIEGTFEVHHKNGEAMDNRPENHVALCRVCHNIREGKKPRLSDIEQLIDHISKDTSETDGSEQTDDGEDKVPSVYLAGTMQDISSEHDAWRDCLYDRHDSSLQRRNYPIQLGSTPLAFNDPEMELGSHGCGIVGGIAGSDMKLIDESDAILAYFDEEEQNGTITELVYAVSEGMPALVIFNSSLFGHVEDPPAEINGVDYHNQSPAYWFLINFLDGEAWNGHGSDTTMHVVETRDQIKDVFYNWDWHTSSAEGLLREFQRA